jgi:hypothetical protein
LREDFVKSSAIETGLGIADFPQALLVSLADSLAPVPVPLVDLSLLETQALSDLLDLLLAPYRVLVELDVKQLSLLLVLLGVLLVAVLVRLALQRCFISMY